MRQLLVNVWLILPKDSGSLKGGTVPYKAVLRVGFPLDTAYIGEKWAPLF